MPTSETHTLTQASSPVHPSQAIDPAAGPMLFSKTSPSHTPSHTPVKPHSHSPHAHTSNTPHSPSKRRAASAKNGRRPLSSSSSSRPVTPSSHSRPHTPHASSLENWRLTAQVSQLQCEVAALKNVKRQNGAWNTSGTPSHCPTQSLSSNL